MYQAMSVWNSLPVQCTYGILILKLNWVYCRAILLILLIARLNNSDIGSNLLTVYACTLVFNNFSSHISSHYYYKGIYPYQYVELY